MVLPQSGVWFMRLYPAENAESFCDGNASAFSFFGGVPTRIVYDNAGYSVKRGSGPLKGRERELCTLFSELRSAFLFEAAFAAPRKGNEKGSVERHVGTTDCLPRRRSTGTVRSDFGRRSSCRLRIMRRAD